MDLRRAKVQVFPFSAKQSAYSTAINPGGKLRKLRIFILPPA